jgi:hypothetical protein
MVERADIRFASSAQSQAPKERDLHGAAAVNHRGQRVHPFPHHPCPLEVTHFGEQLMWLERLRREEIEIL